MQYRNFGKCGFKVSALGFGCMRLPLRGAESVALKQAAEIDNADIDEREATRIARYAIDNGVNYIDTAYLYHQGNSEAFVAKLLKDGYREKVKLATKSPVWMVEKPEDFDRLLNNQLEKLETGFVDLYLLHSLNKKLWRQCVDMNVFSFLDRAKARGRIKYAGFSFHDNLETFEEIVAAYPWDFCQIQLNFMDEHYQAGVEGLKIAAGQGLAVVVMEPLKGGKLARESRPEVKQIWDQAKSKRSPVAWALDWVWNFPEVSVVLSGMSTMEQVQENVTLAGKARANSLTPEELSLITRVKEIYRKDIRVNCSECGYCQPCPSGVLIPDIFADYNNIYSYGTGAESKLDYRLIGEAGKDASNCTECGECESKCPQQVPVITKLKDAHRELRRK